MSNEFFAAVRPEATLFAAVVRVISRHSNFVVRVDEGRVRFYSNPNAEGIPDVSLFVRSDSLTLQLSVEREEALRQEINNVLVDFGYGELFEED